MNNLLRTLGIVAAVSAVFAVGFVAFDYLQTRDKFPSPTFIGTVNVSGLTEKEAAIKLSRYTVAAAYSALLTFEVEQRVFAFSPEQLGLRINYPESVRQAYGATHQEGYLRELGERLQREGAAQLPVFDIDEKQLAGIISGVADEIRSTARDATIVLYEETGGYHIESEELGREIKLGETVKEFKRILASGGKTFPILLSYTDPKVTEKDLRAFPPVYRLAAYTTYYGRHDSPNRIHNIKLVASWIDSTLLMPGDQFSVAEALGEVTPERGFKEAFVIVKGELVPLLGGGSCQIATTLYNSVQLADLKVMQRKSHSMYFNIYPLGRDAGVYPGQLDFKFENDSGHPLLIKAVATNKRLSFRVYGTPTGKKVEFSAPTVYILTASGYRPSTVRQVLDADSPFKTVVTRKVYDAAGKLLKEETINSSYKLYGEKSNVPIARPEPR